MKLFSFLLGVGQGTEWNIFSPIYFAFLPIDFSLVPNISFYDQDMKNGLLQRTLNSSN